MDKFAMNLTWHNCVNFTPYEERNSQLYVTDGKSVYEAVWKDGRFWYRENKGVPIECDENWWWADVLQTVKTSLKSCVDSKKRDNDNYDHVKGIRDNIENVYNGYIYKCPVCGEQIYIEDVDELPEEDEEFVLPCGCKIDDTDDLESVTMWDYFADALDITYYMDSDRETVRGVRIMVACGGPNIYVDTYRRTIELYWWNEHATVDLDSDVCNSIDATFQELYCS